MAGCHYIEGIVFAEAGLVEACRVGAGPDTINRSVQFTSPYVLRIYAESCGLIFAFLGNGGRNAATILSLR